MLLYDTLTQTDLNLFPIIGLTGVADNVAAMLAQAVRYRIDNIGVYYWQSEDAGPGSWLLSDPRYFPSLAPPHAITWLEYEMIPRIRLESGWKYHSDFVGMHVGALVSAIERAPESLHLFDEFEQSIRWLLQGFLWSYSSRRREWLFNCEFRQAVHSDGSPPETNQIPYSMTRTYPPDRPELAEAAQQHIKPFLLAFAFLSAKNTIIVDNDPRPKKPRRKQKKGRSDTSYRTLEIRPLADVLRVRGQTSRAGTGRKLAKVSITRGHFRTYVDDGESRGLFGRDVFGTFWIPSHVRGRGAGPDDKDREVKI